MLPVFEKRENLYFYPTLYEGRECSKNVIYTGAVPNQQQDEFVPWLVEKFGKKWYLIGSNYIYPKEENNYCKKLLEGLGCEVVAEEYVPLGHSEFSSAINKFKSLQHDVLRLGARAVLAHAVMAAPHLEMLLVAVVDQRVEVGNRLRDHVAALAAVAAIRPAELDELLAMEADRAGTAVTALHEDLGFIEEFHLSQSTFVCDPLPQSQEGRKQKGEWPDAIPLCPSREWPR